MNAGNKNCGADVQMPSFPHRLIGRSRKTPHAPANPVARDAQSTDDYVTIQFLECAGGTLHQGTVGYRVGPDTRVALNVWNGPSSSAVGIDLFEAFMTAREELEAEGFIPLVAGAERQCYPSGMARNMGEGDQVYRLTNGKTPVLENLVFIFEPSNAEAVATVAEQAKAFAIWADGVPADDESDN
jgi:hypothetical protein